MEGRQLLVTTLIENCLLMKKLSLSWCHGHVLPLLAVLGLLGAPSASQAQDAPPSPPVSYPNVAAAAAATQNGSARPRLGIGVTDSALINLVVSGSPGARAGLKIGDRVTEFNHHPVVSGEAFVQLVQDTASKQSSITVVRQGKVMHLRVTFATPPQAPAPRVAEEEAAPAPPLVVKTLPPLARQSGVFKGRCTTEGGKPLAKVFINIKGVTTAGMPTYTETHTDANGVYSLRLPPGIYALLEASYPVTLGDTGYDLPLATPDGTNDAADIGAGIVRNLILKIHGKVSPSDPVDKYDSYWGAGLRATLKAGGPLGFEFPADSTVEVTLVPEGPLADGSVGKTLVLSQKNATTQDYDRWRDIPLGQYTVSARILKADGSVLAPVTVGVSRVPNVTLPRDDGYATRLTHVTFPLLGGSSNPRRPLNARAEIAELFLFLK